MMDSTAAAPARSEGAQLDIERLLSRAREQTGLTDFGDPWFLAPLTALVGFINAEGDLVSDEVVPVQQLVGFLADRLRFVDYLKRHPEVRDEKLKVAGVIIGLGRGGSTLLHRLIMASPQLTAPRYWELISPLPVADETPGDPAPRVAIAREVLRRMAEAWPEMASMHPLDAMYYDEEIQLLDRSFLSLMFDFYFHVPSYMPWLAKQDHTKAYEELKLWLQMLQHQDPSRRTKTWFLKSGHHLLAQSLQATVDTFPEAKLIMTHRAMANVIPSFNSLQHTMLRQHSNHLDAHTLGPRAMRLFEASLQALIEFRATQPADRFIDVQYTDMMSDPLGQFARVMREMGLTLTEADQRAAADWMAQNGRDTHPRHRYTPEEFGMRREDFAETFRFYDRAFLAQA